MLRAAEGADIASIGVMMTWLVDDVSTTVKQLAAAGVQFDGPPSTHGEGVKSAFLSGPDGQLLEIEQLWPVRRI